MQAQTSPPAPDYVGQEFQFDNFWTQALPLLQAQLDWAARWQRLLAQPEEEAIATARADLRDRLPELEDFLRDQYRQPARLCLNLDNPPVTGLDPAQRRVYCALYQSWRRWRSLAANLNQPLEPTSLLSLSPASPRLSPDDIFFGPEPVVAPEIPLPAIPEPQPRVISQPPKLSADIDILPAALDSEAAQPLALLAAVRQDVLAVQPLLPEGETLRDRLGEELAAAEAIADYTDFLAQPNTGFARFSPTADAEAFVALPSSQPGYAPLLALALRGETATIAPNPLRYGFFADLGERRLDGRSLERHRWRDYAFFWDYQPPPLLAQIQAHQRAFFFDKLGVGTEYPAAPPFPGEQALELAHTYLLRLVQYDLPEVILNREPIPSERRRYASAILETHSSDLLLAFQPVARHPDGSYTVLWQVVEQFPAPEVADLDRYVRFK